MKNDINNKVDAEDVELAEQYVAALERIKELKDELSWSKDNIEQAEKYLGILTAIGESDVRFDDDNIEQAEKHLKTLIAIAENE